MHPGPYVRKYLGTERGAGPVAGPGTLHGGQDSGGLSKPLDQLGDGAIGGALDHDFRCDSGDLHDQLPEGHPKNFSAVRRRDRLAAGVEG